MSSLSLRELYQNLPKVLQVETVSYIPEEKETSHVLDVHQYYESFPMDIKKILNVYVPREAWFVYRVNGIVTSYMLKSGFVSEEPLKENGLSIPTQYLKKHIENIKENYHHYSTQTIKNAFKYDVMENFYEFREVNNLFADLEDHKHYDEIQDLFERSDGGYGEQGLEIDILNLLVDDDDYFKDAFTYLQKEKKNRRSFDEDDVALILSGFFIVNNWTCLGDDDFWRIARCYGANQNIHSRLDTLTLIIEEQNSVFDELQNFYDPRINDWSRPPLLQQKVVVDENGEIDILFEKDGEYISSIGE